MAESFGNIDPRERLKILSQIKEEGRQLTSIAEEYKNLINANKSILESFTGKLGEESKAIESLSKSLNKDLLDTKKIEKEIAKIRRASLGTEVQIFTLKEKISALISKGKKVTDKEILVLQKAIVFEKDRAIALASAANEAEKLFKESLRIQRLNPFKGLSDVINGVPILNVLLKDLSQATDSFNETLARTNSKAEALGAGLKDYFFLVSKSAQVFVVGTFIKAIKTLDESSVSLANQMNISKMEAADMKESFTAAAQANDELLLSAKDFMKANAVLGTMFGTTARLSDDITSTFTILTERMGIAAEAAGSLANFSAATGQNFMDFTGTIKGTVVAETALSNIMIDQRAVINDIANLSDATKMSMQAQGQSLGKAAFEARKLGLNLADMEKIGNSLLNFEQSIANELEAELITGKELNLERARAAFLNNKMEVFTAEIAKNVGSAADFANMNKIAQDSIAASFGMQRDEFAKMLINQEALKAFSKEGLKTESQAVEEMRKRLLAGESYEKLVKKFGKSEILAKAQNLSIQDKMNKMIEKMYDILDKFVKPVFKFIDKVITSMSGHVKAMMMALGALAIGGPIVRGVLMMSKSSFFKPAGRVTPVATPIAGGAGGAGGVGRSMPVVMGGAAGGAAAAATAGKFYKGGQFLPGGGRAPKGGITIPASGASQLSKVGRFAKFGRVASNPLSLIAGIGLSYGADALKESGHEELGKATSVAGGLVSGAATGAMIGSIIPGIGTAIGGVVGGLIGGGMSAFSEYGEDTEKATEQGSQGVQQAIDQQTAQLTAVLRENRTVSLDTLGLENRYSINYRAMS